MKRFVFFILLCLGLSANLSAQPCLPNPNSLAFNGISSSVRLNPGSSLEITDQITIEAWVYATTFGAASTSGSIVCKHSWDPQTYGYVLRAGGSGQLSFNIGTTSGWQEVTSPVNALTSNTWQHVAGTFDGSTLMIYVNGISQGSTSFTGVIAGNTGLPVRIGGLADTAKGMSRYWNGYIDEVRIWHKALNSAELTAGMNDHINPATAQQLAGYWRLNDAPYPTCPDLSGNGNYGGCFGTSWISAVPFNNLVPPVPIVTFSGGQLHSSASTGNQWYFGSSSIPGATGQNYTPTQYGNYSVQVGDLPCVSMSAPFNYNTTEISENLAQEIRITPNPARDVISIEVPTACFGAELSIIGTGGQLMQHLTLGNDIQQSFDISQLSPGLYFLKITIPGHNSLQKLLVH